MPALVVHEKEKSLKEIQLLTEMSSPLLGVPWGTKWTQDMLKGCANCEYDAE